MPLFSIIVPIYNTEKYICRCIDSILKQSFTDFELILVDDGSTDNSYSICREYARRDNRIKLMQKSNGGVSSARNKGLEYACGELICFIDSDDYIKQEMLEELSNKYWITLSDLLVYGAPLEVETKIKDFNVFLENYYFKYVFGFGPCNKIYLREVIEKNHLKFDEEESIGEDLLFNMNYYFHIMNKGITFISKDYYFYDNRPDSAMNSKHSTRHIQQMRLYRKILEICGDKINEKNKGILFLMHLISGINQSKRVNISKKEYENFLREVFTQYQFDKSIWNQSVQAFLENENASFLGRIRIKLFVCLCRSHAFSMALYLI